jgi:dihydropyrimidinase
MAEYDLLVINGLVVTDQETAELDIAVKDGKIAKLVPRGSLKKESAKKTIDARDGMVMVCLLRLTKRFSFADEE